LTARQDRLRKRRTDLDDREKQIALTQAAQLFDARTINPPGLGAKVAPVLFQCLMMAVALGLAAGGGLGYLAEITDKSFRTPDEIRRRLGLAVVGHIPALGMPRGPDGPPTRIENRVVVHHRPKATESEAYRGVRTALYFSTGGKGHQVIQVTSPNPGDGKSTLSANLAVAIAQSGKRVVLIDCDFRKPRVHKIFGVSPDVGLASVIAGDATLERAIQPSGVLGLSLLPCGPRPANPAELLTSQRFVEVLEEVKRNFDFVLIDTPPLLAVSDPAVVAPRVDGVLLTVRMTRKTRPAAERAKEILNAMGANVVGVVVNDLQGGKSSGIYGYGYGNNYSYGYGYGYADHYGDAGEDSGEFPKPALPPVPDPGPPPGRHLV
jgi:capsular exopolysaccharide synthesis family protein